MICIKLDETTYSIPNFWRAIRDCVILLLFSAVCTRCPFSILAISCYSEVMGLLDDCESHFGTRNLYEILHVEKDIDAKKCVFATFLD